MSDPKKVDEEARHKGMLDALNKGIDEANGTMSDHEFVLIKRAKRLARKTKRTVKEALGELVKSAPGASKVREGIKSTEERIEDAEQ